MSSSTSPLGESLRRREYFDVLYTGLCGAHIAAAVVARGGIVATSKDGWLRKVSRFCCCIFCVGVFLSVCFVCVFYVCVCVLVYEDRLLCHEHYCTVLC